ncbi:MAG: hypothetical protein RL701_4196, partial [Pseudomonadota bacterium]
ANAAVSGSNTVLGLYNSGNLGAAPTPLAIENDTRAQADAAPSPTQDVVNNWLAYKGDLSNLSTSSQAQISIDNQGNANETVPTELPDPINRRVTVLNANTSAMTADYLAPTCSMPSADSARDAIYRFVPSQTGTVRISANYSATAFDPVLALYRGTHDILDERLTLVNTSDTALKALNADATSIKVRNLARTVLFNGPSTSSPDYALVVRDAKTPIGILRTATSTIPNGATLSVDYSYDQGAPLRISQQVVKTINLGATGNTNENVATATQVPVSAGQAYVYTGDTSAMTADIDGSLFTCSPVQVASNDAVFDFSLSTATTVAINSEGSGYDTALALFDSPITRPSTTLRTANAAIEQKLYDVKAMPGSPEATCRPITYNTHRYWVCGSDRPWEQAEGMCQAVGLHLATIDDAFENAALLTEIQTSGKSHHIGFQQIVPYTNSWGAWVSGGGGTTGAAVSGRFTRWAVGEPNGLGNCAQMLGNGAWDDEDCAVPHGYVCELPNTTTTPSVPTGSTCGALVTYGGHRYRVCTDTLDWFEARKRCQQTGVGMDLARIEDQAENDQLRVLLAGKAGWIGGSDVASEGNWFWADNAGFWVVSAYRNWDLSTNEPNQVASNPGSRMRAEDGKWVDVPTTYEGYRYICEDPAPGALVAPPTSSAPQSVDVFGSQRAFVGSTESTPNSVGGFIECGSSAVAPDAVFTFQLAYDADVLVDMTGSFAGSVVGLFKGVVSATGYNDGGKRCASVSAAAPQLSASLSAGTYYVAVTGTAAASSGNYKLVFDARTTSPAAFAMENDTLSDAMANPLGPVDGTWLVKRADMSKLTPTLGAVRSVNMSANLNDVNPQALDPVTGYQVQTANASTATLGATFPGGSCDPSASGPDAIYQFTPTADGTVQVRLKTTGFPAQVVLFDGVSGAPLDSSQTAAPPYSLAPTYSNESRLTALDVGTIGKAQAFLGDLTPMVLDVPGVAFNQAFNRRQSASANICNADPVGADGFFKFTLAANKTVEISTGGTEVPQTLALWDSKPFTPPSTVTLAYDTKSAALAAP